MKQLKSVDEMNLPQDEYGDYILPGTNGGWCYECDNLPHECNCDYYWDKAKGKWVNYTAELNGDEHGLNS